MALYGGYALRRGDSDAARLYGGIARPDDDGVHVARLRRNLVTLGFLIAGHRDPGKQDGDFDGNVEDAVREFQIAARGPQVAVETPSPMTFLLDRLRGPVSIAPPLAYPAGAPVSGVVNARTAACIATWQGNGWRNPLLAVPWRRSKTGWTRDDRIVALAHDVGSKAPRVFLHTFTDAYGQPPSGAARQDGLALGDYMTYPAATKGAAPWSGPRLSAAHEAPKQALITPTALVGQPIAACSERQRSTFRVIAAVAEVECEGRFSSINAYDAAALSAGLYHWTIISRRASKPNAVGAGELMGFLAFLAASDPETYARTAEAWGIRPANAWGANGGALLDPIGRTYTSMIQRPTETLAGTVEWRSVGGMPDAGMEADRLRSWAWVQRFAMALRTDAGFRRAMWAFARLRLYEIARIPLAHRGVWAGRTIGQAFGSERAMAIILRAHVNLPGAVVTSEEIEVPRPPGTPGPPRTKRLPVARAGLLKVLADAGADAGTAPDRWPDAVHVEIVRRTVAWGTAHTVKTIRETAGKVAAWKGRVGTAGGLEATALLGEETLREGKGSFLFDDADITPTPPSS